MFKQGDKYIHYTKYGGVNIGEVKDVAFINGIDTDNKVIYQVPHIITTNGILLSLNGDDGNIYKIVGELSDDKSKIINDLLESSHKRKEEINKILTKKNKL
jgi:hypothetical protein